MNFSYDGKAQSRNYTGIALVVALHILLIYGLIKGLSHKKVDIIEQPVETTIIKEIVPPPIKKPDPPKMVKTAPTPPPPPVAPPVFVPKVEVQIATPTPTVVTVSTPAPPAPTPPAPAPVAPAAPAVTTHSAVSTSSRSGCGTPKYPDQAREDGEEGVTRLALQIGTSGKVTSAKIDKSSGYSDLDRAALSALSLCVFKPATTDGMPVESWIKMEWAWKLD